MTAGQSWKIKDFCAVENISASFLYNEWKAGRGPDFFFIVSHRRISEDARARWREAREAEARLAVDKLEQASERARAVRRAASESITKRDSIA
jgi:hypothetical protein